MSRTSPHRILVALGAVVLSYGLMQTMLVPAIGDLQVRLHASPAAASWAVLSGLLLCSAVVTPLIGRLADRYGKRRVLLASLGVYLAGALGAIVAPNVGVLIACRVVQGTSLALLPLSFAIVREALPPRLVARGLAVTAGLVTGTAGVGLLVGGLLVDHTSWRWLFVVGSAIIATALALTAAYVPESAHRSPGRLDVPGTVLLGAGLAALLLGITQGPAWGWTAPPTLGLFAAAALTLTGFVLVERRVADPLVDLALLRRRRLAVAHLGALALGINQFVLYVLLPRLAELPAGLPPDVARLVHHGFGTSVTGAALILLPGTLLTMPASWTASWLDRRLGSAGSAAPLAIGLGLAALGAGAIAAWHATAGAVLGWYLVVSIGYGLAMAALPRLVNHASPAHQSGAANGVNTVARTVGGAIGAQLAAATLAADTIPGTAAPADHAFTLGFVLAATIAAAGAVGLPLARHRRRGADPDGSSGSGSVVRRPAGVRD